MTNKLYKWKAYRADGCWRVYKNRLTAVKFAGTDGWVVDLYKSFVPEQ